MEERLTKNAIFDQKISDAASANPLPHGIPADCDEYDAISASKHQDKMARWSLCPMEGTHDKQYPFPIVTTNEHCRHF